MWSLIWSQFSQAKFFSSSLQITHGLWTLSKINFSFLLFGFLLAINDNKQSIENLKKQLKLEGHFFKLPAKANGLYLAKIKY